MTKKNVKKKQASTLPKTIELWGVMAVPACRETPTHTHTHRERERERERELPSKTCKVVEIVILRHTLTLSETNI